MKRGGYEVFGRMGAEIQTEVVREGLTEKQTFHKYLNDDLDGQRSRSKILPSGCSELFLCQSSGFWVAVEKTHAFLTVAPLFVTFLSNALGACRTSWSPLCHLECLNDHPDCVVYFRTFFSLRPQTLQCGGKFFIMLTFISLPFFLISFTQIPISNTWDARKSFSVFLIIFHSLLSLHLFAPLSEISSTFLPP